MTRGGGEYGRTFVRSWDDGRPEATHTGWSFVIDM